MIFTANCDTIKSNKVAERRDDLIFPSNINITGLSVSKCKFKKSASIEVSGRTFHSLTFRTAGEVTVFPNGSKKQLISFKDCITYVPKGCSYITKISEDGEMIVMHFETLSEFNDVIPFVHKPTFPAMFESMFCSLYERSKNINFQKWDYRCVSIAYEIFSKLCSELNFLQTVSIPKRMRNIKKFIDENYSTPKIPISFLSKSICLSEVYFRWEFKNCFGLSPNEYIKKVRLENAKLLLSTGLYSVGEIATKCGFDSISYFSYEFKKRCGKSPREFAAEFEEK